MGADIVLDLARTTPERGRQAVLDATHGEGADVVIEAAGAAAAISEGLDLARVGGRYVIAGHYTDVGDSTINAHQQINRKHLEIRGCWGSEARHFLRALSILERHPSIPFRKIGARRYGLRPVERGARRRRSDADSESAGRSMAVTRHTKIVATLGPASTRAGRARRARRRRRRRLPAEFLARHARVARAGLPRGPRGAARAGRHVAILQDLSGPKIRTGRLRGGQPIDLRRGDELRLAAGDDEGGPGRVFTPYAELIASAQPGDRLLLDDGKIELRVTRARRRRARHRVVNGGKLGEHKGINAPGVTLPAAAVTPKDEADLKFGLELGVDMVALSFVQTPDDCHAARRIMRAANTDVPLIAKIERPQALEHLDAILRRADGVMVARGDLGLECPLEQIPRIQKAIIARARALGRPVIVATQVLESMRTEPRPTRAEVSDAATAVDQGVDAIMLVGRNGGRRLSGRGGRDAVGGHRRRGDGRDARRAARAPTSRSSGRDTSEPLRTASTPSAPSTAARCARPP